MNGKKLLSLWGLKWNPFSPELPSEGLLATPKIESFAWRVEQLVQEGGFALINGESGTGKSVALRIVAERLSALRDVVVGVLERPQSKNADFYRELGEIFSVKLRPSNRYGGFKALARTVESPCGLLAHQAGVVGRRSTGDGSGRAERTANPLQRRLRRHVAVDHRPCGRWASFGSAASSGLGSAGTRIRTRLCTEAATRDELLELLKHALVKAGNATLMTDELMDVLVDHSAGNYRLLMTMSAELLAYGIAHEVSQLDEKFYLELFHPKGPMSKKKARA